MISISDQPIHMWTKRSQTIQDDRHPACFAFTFFGTILEKSSATLISSSTSIPSYSQNLFSVWLLWIFLIVRIVHPFLSAKIMYCKSPAALQWLELLILLFRGLHIFLFPIFCPSSKPNRQIWKVARFSTAEMQGFLRLSGLRLFFLAPLRV